MADGVRPGSGPLADGLRQAPARPPGGQPRRPKKAAPPGGAGRRPVWKVAFFALVIAAIVAGAGWVLLGSRFFVVRSVQVTGTGAGLSRSQVLAAAGDVLGQPLIRVDDAAVARRVGQLRQVQSAQVSTSWPATLVISVRQRVPVFAVAASTGYLVIDRFGVTLRVAAQRPAGLPLLTAGTAAPPPGALRGNPVVRAAAMVLAELPHQVRRHVTTVTAATASGVSLRLANGTVIVWGGPGQGSLKARELTVLMRRHAHLYDVSGPTTAVTQG